LKAVHFGAGNIGRGFIGQLLNQAGYEIAFLDVNEELVNSLKAADTYEVIESGVGAKNHTIGNFTAFNTSTELSSATKAIAEASIVTASVGVNVLKHVAPVIAQALAERTIPEPLVIMACENAIAATNTLKHELQLLNAPVEKAIFANTAVDRIVPPQATHSGLDVVVESFSEWIIDAKPFQGKLPEIPGAKFVHDLSPYIERKLFTVNTGHASLAYLGQQAGLETVFDAANDAEVLKTVRAVLMETSEVLIERHEFDRADHMDYVEKTLARFENPDLHDPVERVGRQPARKLARTDRLISPAAHLAEMGKEPSALLAVVEAALRFTDATDPSVEELRVKRTTLSAKDFVSEVMGITEPHPLAESLTNRVESLK
jgi:mannitol-1-phosphate 5-dehydrogenase